MKTTLYMVGYCVVKGLDMEILRISHYSELPSITQEEEAAWFAEAEAAAHHSSTGCAGDGVSISLHFSCLATDKAYYSRDLARFSPFMFSLSGI